MNVMHISFEVMIYRNCQKYIVFLEIVFFLIVILSSIWHVTSSCIKTKGQFMRRCVYKLYWHTMIIYNKCDRMSLTSVCYFIWCKTIRHIKENGIFFFCYFKIRWVMQYWLYFLWSIRNTFIVSNVVA